MVRRRRLLICNHSSVRGTHTIIQGFSRQVRLVKVVQIYQILIEVVFLRERLTETGLKMELLMLFLHLVAEDFSKMTIIINTFKVETNSQDFTQLSQAKASLDAKKNSRKNLFLSIRSHAQLLGCEEMCTWKS